jgi:hypothetical protein
LRCSALAFPHAPHRVSACQPLPLVRGDPCQVCGASSPHDSESAALEKMEDFSRLLMSLIRGLLILAHVHHLRHATPRSPLAPTREEVVLGLADWAGGACAARGENQVVERRRFLQTPFAACVIDLARRALFSPSLPHKTILHSHAR